MTGIVCNKWYNLESTSVLTCYYGCSKRNYIGVVDRRVLYEKHDLLTFMVLSHSLDMHHLVFLLFYWQLALAEMSRTLDLAIFVTTTATTMTELITLPLCAFARGNNNYSLWPYPSVYRWSLQPKAVLLHQHTSMLPISESPTIAMQLHISTLGRWKRIQREVLWRSETWM